MSISKYSLVLEELAKNIVMAVPTVSRWRARRGRTSGNVERIDGDFLQRHAYSLYEMVIRHIGAMGIENMDIGEIGPGDHIPAALLFLAGGAKSYSCYDRFPGDVSGDYAKSVYRALICDLQRNHPEMADRLKKRQIDPNTFPEMYPSLVQIVAKPIELIGSSEYESLDLLTSFNVVEHTYGLNAFAGNSFNMLRRGGVAIHRVDFGPHGKWVNQQNPLEWLTIPNFIWKLMISNRGMPNRWRFHEIKEALELAGFEIKTDELEFFDKRDLELVRDSLPNRILDMPENSLMVKTAVICCRQPSFPAL